MIVEIFPGLLWIITYQSAHRPKFLPLHRVKIKQDMLSGQILVYCMVTVRQHRPLFHLPAIPNIFSQILQQRCLFNIIYGIMVIVKLFRHPQCKTSLVLPHILRL